MVFAWFSVPCLCVIVTMVGAVLWVPGGGVGGGGGSKPVRASLFYLDGPKRQVMTPVEHPESQKVLTKHNPAH